MDDLQLFCRGDHPRVCEPGKDAAFCHRLQEIFRDFRDDIARRLPSDLQLRDDSARDQHVLFRCLSRTGPHLHDLNADDQSDRGHSGLWSPREGDRDHLRTDRSPGAASDRNDRKPLRGGRALLQTGL